MIGWLEGPIQSLEADRVIINVNGIGYLVHIPLSTYYRLEGAARAALHIHTHVREDALALYGFASENEKIAFEKLISISGIGPRLAQVILSGIDTSELAEAVMRGDTRRLSSIPGVGRKTSERLCLELRDKLVLTEKEEAARPARPSGGIEDDVISALVNLGYKANAAESALRAAREEIGSDAELSTLLKASLRRLTR
ncbi:MAG TPA: Holliday junction branch migration protein RuvA [Thermoanaerobaculia bacterium]|nr:Holliday junction branch migration protein RuvA [Thermoanaerobaculia bacterium]